VLAALLLTLFLTLILQGYTHHLFGVSLDARPAGPATGVPNAVRSGGPLIDARGTVRTAQVPTKVIALTFDDGPNADWTPQILKILREHRIHATFFVVGTQAISNPALIRQIVSDGNEIGIHTLTHADLTKLPAWWQRLEINDAQLVVAGITGIKTALLRPPYSSENNAVDNRMWNTIHTAAQSGYLTVLTTVDSEDWQRPGVAHIVANSTPQGTSGEILLMHDSGGDRSETVAALPQVIAALERRGFAFETVSQAMHLRGVETRASTGERIAGNALILGIRVSAGAVQVLDAVLLIAGAVSVLRALLVLTAAARHRRVVRPKDGVSEPVSVIVPAYNEEAGIEASLRSILASDHAVEVIVVDDGSTDQTATIVEDLDLPGVHLIRKANGGKPSALNAGIAEASHELIVMVDGDTVFEPDTIRTLVQAFADPAVGAVSGNAKVLNRTGLLGHWQHIEYVIGFNLDRRLFDLAECMPTVPGAIGGFRRSALAGVGGVSSDTLAEDTDLTMALCRSGWRVVYEENAIAWTEAPATLGALWKQRYRWSYGTFQAMWKHRATTLQKGQAGKLGRRGLLYLFTFQILLPLLAPAVDVFALYGFAFLNPLHVAEVWLAFLALQTVMGVYAFHVDGESLRPLWTLPLQQFVYRQLMYLVVIQSLFTAASGLPLRWQRMERYGTLASKG
jgi:cellulose synthase/poly-beta-1,6-N-acetylglucosamine synthase-like glycosyltransferase/peptidoglycan/xylan/chitin deacetylase (PgdA/CDA1 family)